MLPDIERKDVPKTFMQTLLKAYANKMGLRVDFEEGKAGDTEYTRHDVIGKRDAEEWFCFSLVLIRSDNSVGIWNREMMGRFLDPQDVEPLYQFESSTFERWLDGWFENAVLEELTRPL